VNRALHRYAEAASGLTHLTTAKAEQIAKQLVKSGEAAQDQMGELVEELLERQKKNREAIAALVKSETNRAVRAMGLATNKEVERLQRQVADMKRELNRVEGQVGAAKKTAKKASKKSSRKKAAKKGTRKKASAKKATSKKASAKKATRKKASAKKATGKKATARKSTGS
jgi:polyhydroxyalkanoate synthesis regulator phasin